MKNIPSFLLFLVCVFCLTNASAQVLLNGGFEKIDPKSKLPVGWNNFMGDSYAYKLDSTTVKEAKYSIIITPKKDNADFGAISCVIPYTFKGHNIQLKGFMKTEDITGGYGGFWLRIDGTSTFDNMAKENVHGTTDWTEYTIDLPYDDDKAININAGALLVGKGKMWIDNIRVFIDGVPVEKAKLKPAEVFKATIDTSFLAGSQIKLSAVTDQQIKNLTLLGQVWGFVKYHLPAVARGDINMDAELFRIMPGVLNAPDTKAASDAMAQWLDKLGTPEPCGSCKPFDDKNTSQKADYGEIFDRSVVSAKLADKLNFILANRNNKETSYYIVMERGVGNPDFKNERPYIGMTYPDAGYRLLCLFRFWNMIQYFSPYKHLIGKDWNTALPEFIPQFVAAKDTEDYQVAAMALISSIHDTHANIYTNAPGLAKYRGKFTPPFQAKFIEGKLTVTGYYIDTLGVKDKIKVGDVITTINGAPVDELIKKYLPLTAASNYETQLRDMPRNYLLRSGNQNFIFGILRDGKAMTVNQEGVNFTTINYYKAPDGPGFKLINDQVGYLYPGKYFNKDLPQIKKLFKDTKGIVIDMRCYPSEFMPFTFVPWIKSGDAKFVKFTKGSITDPGNFVLTEPLGIKPEGAYKGKVVVIVNSESQSQAEYTTMAFQSSPNVTVIGSTTAGADGNVSAIVLPGNIHTIISGIGILYPDGTETQRKGVKIDVHAEPTIEGIKAGRDEPLEKAIALIAGN
jgi:hypothetical protein